MPNTTVDPRPQLAAALDQVQRQVQALTPEELALGTPCDAFDVRTLVAHLIAVLRKLTAAKAHEATTQVADPATDVGGDEHEAFLRARQDLDHAWGQASQDELDAYYAMAWGEMSGVELLDAYAHEFTVHAWDLVQATGRDADLDPALAEAALAWFTENVGADGRGDGGPFGAPVPVPEGSDPYTRLAGYVGRDVRHSTHLR